MILRRLGILGMLLSIGHFVAAQSIAVEKVNFDPSFWNSQLKLSHHQRQKIDEINYRFYQTIKEATLKGGSKKSFTSDLEKALQTRSENIEQLFMPRQKRKWEKISKDFLQASHREVSSLGERKFTKGVF